MENEKKIDPEFSEKNWYAGFCNEKEIERILNPKSSWDYLLKKRADIISNHSRYTRVFFALSSSKEEICLEKCFSNDHYEEYINLLSKNNSAKIQNVAFGDMFSNDFNGYTTFNRETGVIVYLNESLRFFNNFINLSLLDHILLPEYIRINALRIAIRIALKTETMDFLLDPRGTIPKDIFYIMKQTTQDELQYVAGHEFAHYLCGHLDDAKTESKVFFSLDSRNYVDKIYNLSQKQEFEADEYSIKNVTGKVNRQRLIRAALIWFSSLELVEYVYDIVAPGTLSYTHPSAKERYENILNKFYINRSIKKELAGIRQKVEDFKCFLAEDISFNFDFYEVYGSAYLDEPNTKWRGRELIDRIDY